MRGTGPDPYRRPVTDPVLDRPARLSRVLALVVAAIALVAGRRLEAVDVARESAQLELERLVESLREGRDEAWEWAERIAVELAEERARFTRSIGQLDDQFCTLHVDARGRIGGHFATPDPVGLLSPVVAHLVGVLDGPDLDPASART